MRDQIAATASGAHGRLRFFRAMALAAARCGAEVVIASRNYESWVTTAKEIEADCGRTAMPYAVHVGRPLGPEVRVNTLMAGRNEAIPSSVHLERLQLWTRANRLEYSLKLIFIDSVKENLSIAFCCVPIPCPT